MPSMRSLGALARRAEVRLGLALAASISGLMFALLGLLFVVASYEAAEVVQEGLQAELATVARRLEAGHNAARFHASPSGASLRWFDERGRSHALYGTWPSKGRFFGSRTNPLQLAVASRKDHATAQLALPDGGRLEGAISLRAFVEERREQLGQLGLGFAIGLVGVLGVAVYATRLALAPLRSTTRALAHVDEHHLGERIPTRGTDDDVDRHAVALNRVLERLEASFARMAAFSADTAHELRTPINRLLNQVDVALLSSPSEALGLSLDGVRATALEMARLVEDMLLLARGEEGRLPVRPERLALGELIDNLAELYRPSCEERRVVLSVLERDDPVRSPPIRSSCSALCRTCSTTPSATHRMGAASSSQ